MEHRQLRQLLKLGELSMMQTNMLSNLILRYCQQNSQVRASIVCTPNRLVQRNLNTFEKLVRFLNKIKICYNKCKSDYVNFRKQLLAEGQLFYTLFHIIVGYQPVQLYYSFDFDTAGDVFLVHLIVNWSKICGQNLPEIEMLYKFVRNL